MCHKIYSSPQFEKDMARLAESSLVFWPIDLVTKKDLASRFFYELKNAVLCCFPISCWFPTSITRGEEFVEFCQGHFSAGMSFPLELSRSFLTKLLVATPKMQPGINICDTVG